VKRYFDQSSQEKRSWSYHANVNEAAAVGGVQLGIRLPCMNFAYSSLLVKKC
jgi:hypothetical protein